MAIRKKLDELNNKMMLAAGHARRKEFEDIVVDSGWIQILLHIRVEYNLALVGCKKCGEYSIYIWEN